MELLRVLQIEDAESDAALNIRVLERAGYRVQSERVDDGAALARELDRQQWDVIIADYRLPQFDANAALAALKKTGRDIPFIVVSGCIGEDSAVALMKAGAHDYVAKSNLARLPLSVEREIREARARRDNLRAQEALRASEERLRLAQVSADIGVWEWYPSTGEMKVTPEFERLYGANPGTMTSYEVCRRFVHPDDAARIEAQWAEAVKGCKALEVEFRIFHSSGELRWISSKGAAICDDNGDVSRVLGINIEITNRKRAEEELRQSEQAERARAAELAAIMDAVPLATFVSRDPDCRDVFGSRMTYDLLKLPPGSNASKSAGVPAPFRIVKNGIELEPYEMPMQIAARTGRAVENCELDFVLEDGTCRHMFGNAVPLLDDHGKPRGAVAAFLDITERKQMEERLRTAQKAESIGLLAGGVAHDFNNILTAVTGNVSLALEDLSPHSVAAPYLQIALDSVERAAGLTRQLLAYAGKGGFRRERVCASQIAKDTIQLLRPSLSKGVELRTTLDPALPPVLMDPSQMQQIFLNLILNAAEAIGDSKPGVVSVRTAVEGKSICIEVADTGCGMDRATEERIFDPFFTTKFMGRGLGLAAVQGIVRSLNGTISVDSAPSRGTTFRVSLPIQDIPEGSGISSPRQTYTAASGAVLIVDDEPSIRQVAMAVLCKRGITVHEASNGREAVDLLRSRGGAIRAILLDITMPELEGDEALAIISALRPDVRVIVSSGHSAEEVGEKFSSARVCSFLPKPYTGEQLLAHVLPALNGGAGQEKP